MCRVKAQSWRLYWNKGPWLIEGVKALGRYFIFIFSHYTRRISQENLKKVSILKYEMHT
jgi:hypothetical protein